MRVGLCALSDVREAARAALATLPRPSGPPPSDVIRAPIWTTWAKYKQQVDQTKVLTFAREIVANQLTGSVMEIDDKWQAGTQGDRGDRNVHPFHFIHPSDKRKGRRCRRHLRLNSVSFKPRTPSHYPMSRPCTPRVYTTRARYLKSLKSPELNSI